ncbi:MAG: alpha/beta fold hydrolase [Phycisphaerae bacterium]|nr:alpha/beta fold hydrolase [Phycisphaerae bacterium]
MKCYSRPAYRTARGGLLMGAGLSSLPVIGLVLLLAAGLVLAWLSMVAWTYHALTHPPRRTYASAVARGRPGTPLELSDKPLTFTEWTVRVDGNGLPVWDIAGENPARPTIILTHGWGDSRIGALSRMAALAPLASRLLAWDMRGHGDAPGRCALGLREAEDLAALIERARGDVVLYGWSLGAGVSIAAAVNAGEGGGGRARIIGVIAEAPYRLGMTVARNVMRAWGYPYRATLPPAQWLVGLRELGRAAALNDEAFDRAALSRRLRVPLLVLHGEADPISPPADGRDIASAAPRATLVMVPGGGHHGLWTEQRTAEVCENSVATWLSEVTTGTGSRLG